MWKQLLPAIRMTLALTVLTGLLYPGLVTGLCQLLFPQPANGSLITQNGRVVGSELIGQNFTRPEYFQPRPSAAGNDGYDPTASGGSNFGPDQSEADRPGEGCGGEVPQGKPGLHRPHSGRPAHRQRQRPGSPSQPGVGRGAGSARGQGSRCCRKSRSSSSSPNSPRTATSGFLGEPRVNVLKLNLALDQTVPGQVSRIASRAGTPRPTQPPTTTTELSVEGDTKVSAPDAVGVSPRSFSQLLDAPAGRAG